MSNQPTSRTRESVEQMILRHGKEGHGHPYDKETAVRQVKELIALAMELEAALSERATIDMPARYDMNCYNDNDIFWMPSPTGDWVKWSDISSLFER